LKADIEKKFPDANITMIKGSGGVFEVMKDGELIFSKKLLKRFPEHDEIFAKMQ